MPAKCLIVTLTSVALMVLGIGGIYGQTYPNKPVRIITGSPGGGNDLVARLIAQGISGPLGQPVIVENRGSTLLTAPIVAQAPPDGYLLLVGANVMWLDPLISGKQPNLEGFSVVSTLVSSPNVLVIHPSLPAKSVKELIAIAKARPRQLNFAASTVGSSSQLAGEMLNSMAGIKVVGIPYKGVAASLNAVRSGEVEMGFLTPVGLDPHIKEGKLRALAVTSLGPSALAPGLPTMASAGFPEFEISQMAVMFVPAKTPGAIITRLNHEIVRVLDKPDTKEKLLATGVEPVSASPEQSVAIIKTTIASMAKVIKEAGIKVNN